MELQELKSRIFTPGVFFGIVLLIPAAIVQVWFEKITGKQPKSNKKPTENIKFETLKMG